MDRHRQVAVPKLPFKSAATPLAGMVLHYDEVEGETSLLEVVGAPASMEGAVVVISHLACQLSCFLMAQFMFEQVSLHRNLYLNEKVS